MKALKIGMGSRIAWVVVGACFVIASAVNVWAELPKGNPDSWTDKQVKEAIENDLDELMALCRKEIDDNYSNLLNDLKNEITRRGRDLATCIGSLEYLLPFTDLYRHGIKRPVESSMGNRKGAAYENTQIWKRQERACNRLLQELTDLEKSLRTTETGPMPPPTTNVCKNLITAGELQEAAEERRNAILCLGVAGAFEAACSVVPVPVFPRAVQVLPVLP